jgi:hypothetical protein
MMVIYGITGFHRPENRNEASMAIKLAELKAMVQSDGTVTITANVGNDKAGQRVVVTIETDKPIPFSGPLPGEPIPGGLNPNKRKS